MNDTHPFRVSPWSFRSTVDTISRTYRFAIWGWRLSGPRRRLPQGGRRAPPQPAVLTAPRAPPPRPATLHTTRGIGIGTDGDAGRRQACHGRRQRSSFPAGCRWHRRQRLAIRAQEAVRRGSGRLSGGKSLRVHVHRHLEAITGAARVQPPETKTGPASRRGRSPPPRRRRPSRKRVGERYEYRRAQSGAGPLLGEVRLGGRAGAEAAAEQRRTGCGAPRAPRAQAPSTRPSCCASSPQFPLQPRRRVAIGRPHQRRVEQALLSTG